LHNCSIRNSVLIKLIASSEDNLQRAIHRLNVISKDYNMRISIDKTKVLALRGKDPIRIKIVINERNLDQVLNFNYLGYNMGLNREIDINVKLQRFQQICDTIKRTLAGEVRKETLLRFYKIRQYQLFCMAHKMASAFRKNGTKQNS
jgi:hypothetical protein